MQSNQHSRRKYFTVLSFIFSLWSSSVEITNFFYEWNKLYGYKSYFWKWLRRRRFIIFIQINLFLMRLSNWMEQESFTFTLKDFVKFDIERNRCFLILNWIFICEFLFSIKFLMKKRKIFFCFKKFLIFLFYWILENSEKYSFNYHI